MRDGKRGNRSPRSQEDQREQGRRNTAYTGIKRNAISAGKRSERERSENEQLVS